MRHTLGIVGLGLAVAFSATASAAQVDDELWWEDDGESYFHTAVNDYYDVPVNSPPPPSYLRSDELPVVYLLAREARVSPEVVMALREMGWSWMDITYHLGVDPYVYVSRLPRRSGYWGWYGGRDYRYLTDRHIIDYVNLVFWADYYRRPVTQVIIIRETVPSWFYYARYYAPPRVVYVRNPVRWSYYGPSRRGDNDRRGEPVRRAEPRAGTGVTGTRTATRPTTEARRPTQPSRATSQPTRPTTRSATAPTRPTQPGRATAQPSRPPQSGRAVTQPSRPAQGSRPAAQPSRSVRGSRPAAQPSRPAQGSRPAAQPSRPASSSRPAAQPSRPAQSSRPAAQPSRPAQSSRPAAQSRPSSGSRPAASSQRSTSGGSRAATSPRRPSRPGG
jgi:hypothetical protein